MKFSIEDIINRHIYARGRLRKDIAEVLDTDEKSLSYRLNNEGSLKAKDFIKIIEYLTLNYYKLLHLHIEDYDGSVGMKMIRMDESMHDKANQEVMAYIEKLINEEDNDPYATKDIDKKLKAEFSSMSYVVDALLPMKNEYGDEYKIYIKKLDKGGAKEGECSIWPPYGEYKPQGEYEIYLYNQNQKDFMKQIIKSMKDKENKK